ncbi:MAG: hypothetical protein JNM25_00770 [Planctomycetes bacterium]|nr:hypothetical protein [Planctomycetota bacterium]
MKNHAIIELDEGALTVTIGGRIDGAPRVLHCHRVALADLGRETVAAALQPIALDLLQQTDGVHVILGDRRMQHFVSSLPNMRPREIDEFVVREALRLTSMPNAGEALVASRLVRRLKGGKWIVGGTALPRSVWEPVRLAFAAGNVGVASLQSTESCLALAVPPEDQERYAVVECSGGRARFVLCDGRSPVQVRRFMVGSAESNPEALAAQLAMELPRTLEWLRETGHQVPSALVLGNRISVDEGTLDLIRGDLARVVLPAFVADSGRGFEAPSLASTALLAELCQGHEPVSLLTGPRLRLPPSPWRPVTLAAAVAVGALLGWHGVRDLEASATVEREVVEASSERENLRHQLVAVTGEPADAMVDGESAQLLRQALGRRRPVSRLLAEVSNAATPDVALDGLQFASSEQVVVSGVVSGPSRAAALAMLAEFAGRVRDLPYLESVGQEDVSEVAGTPSRFRFRLTMAWRTS